MKLLIQACLSRKTATAAQLPAFELYDGVGVGIKAFTFLSNGEQIANPKFLRQSEQKLKKAQRRASRKKRGSQCRKKAITLLRKQHLLVNRQRGDFLHETSLSLVCHFDEIAVEELNIKNYGEKSPLSQKHQMMRVGGTF